MSDDRPSLEPTIEVRSPQPGVVLVVLSGEHDLTSADELRQTFDQSLSRCDHLIVDLSRRFHRLHDYPRTHGDEEARD